MANVRAFRAGNWSDTNTTTSPWATGGVLYAPDSSDDVYLNGFIVTVDNSPTVISVTNASATSRLWKDGATTTAAAGGSFVLNNGVTLTANVTNGTATICSMASGAATIVGNINAVSATAINLTSTAFLTVTGNMTAGSSAGNCIYCTGSSSVTVTGNITGGSAANARGIFNQGTGVITATGTLTAGGGSTSHAIFADAAGTISVIGDCTASTSAHAISSTNASGVVKASGSFISASNGRVAVYAPVFYLDTAPTVAKTRYALNGTSTFVDMFTADNNLTQAAPADVRSGTVYADGNLTGTLAVPAAASVAFGVPVDNTTGTAALTPASVWDHLLSAITTSSTIGKLLKDNVDATISSRSTATTAGIADAVWDEVMSGHTISGTYGDRIVRSLNSNNTLQLTGSHHAAADVHQFQPDVIDSAAIAASAITEIATGVRTELATELTAITELHLIHGLKSGSTLTVTPTSRSAGAVSQTIGGDGTTSTTVSRD